jgi:hypothetical protein
MAKKIAKPLNDYRCKDCAHLGADNPNFTRNADRSPILAECLMNKPYYTNKMRRACEKFKLKH